SCARTGNIQPRHDRRCVHSHTVDGLAGVAACHGNCHLRDRRGDGTDPHPVPGTARRRISISRVVRAARSRFAPGLAVDGPWNDWPRGDAGERVRQYAARYRAGDRSGIMALIRVPADVLADRPFWRIDRHGGAPSRVETCRSQQCRTDPRYRFPRCLSDVDAEHTGDTRPDDAGNPDRPAPVRTRTFPAGGYRSDGGGAAPLCGGLDWLLHGTDRVADLLRAATKPTAGGGEHLDHRVEHRVECDSGASDRVPGPGARNRTLR